jgi:hypothetical protein
MKNELLDYLLTRLCYLIQTVLNLHRKTIFVGDHMCKLKLLETALEQLYHTYP